MSSSRNAIAQRVVVVAVRSQAGGVVVAAPASWSPSPRIALPRLLSADRHHPGVADLAVEPHRLLEPRRAPRRSRAGGRRSCRGWSSRRRSPSGRRAPSAAPAPARGTRAGQLVVAAILGDDAEVGEQAAHAGLVAEPLADRPGSPRSSRPPCRSRRAARRACRRGAATWPTPASRRSDLEAASAARSSSVERLVVAPLLARDSSASAVSHQARERSSPSCSASASASRVDLLARAASRRRARAPCRACSSTSTRSRLVHERRQRARSSRWRPRSRSCACAASPARTRYSRFFASVVAVPVVVREEVELALDGVGLGLLDVRADALVQHRPDRERHALVGHLLRDDVLEAGTPRRPPGRA